jgi:transcription antitermination factor NusG
MEREELVQKVKRYMEENGIKKTEMENLKKDVKGILVATAFDEKVKDQLKKSKEFEGIQIRRLVCNKLKESYIFIEHIPERRASLPISGEEFWRLAGTRRKNKVERILGQIKKEMPEIALEYWKSMISIYPSKDARASRKRIARYVRGDKTIQVKMENGEYNRISLEDESMIIEGIKKFRQE